MRYTVKQCNKEAKAKGLKIVVRSISRSNPYGAYTTGYLVTDNDGFSHRWQRLDDLHLNCIELGRKPDGFARW